MGIQGAGGDANAELLAQEAAARSRQEQALRLRNPPNPAVVPPALAGGAGAGGVPTPGMERSVPPAPPFEPPLTPTHGAELPLMHDISRTQNTADFRQRAGAVPPSLAGGAGAPAMPQGDPRGGRPGAGRPGAGRPAARPGGMSEADQLNQRELDRIQAAKGQGGGPGGDLAALKDKKAALLAKGDQAGGQGDRGLLQRLFGYSKGGLVRHQPRWDFGASKSSGDAGSNRYAKSKR